MATDEKLGEIRSPREKGLPAEAGGETEEERRERGEDGESGSGNTGAEARKVMGMALLGGMALATFLGVFLYPMLFVFIGKIAGYEKKRDQENLNSLETTNT